MNDYVLITAENIYEDAPLLATTKALAFWEQAWWKILWGDRPFEDVKNASIARLPWILLKGRNKERHLLVKHAPSNTVAGYARYIVPESLYETGWTSMQPPEVTDETTRQKWEEAHKSADWHQPVNTDALDPPIDRMKAAHTPKYPVLKLDYLCTHPDHQNKGIAKMLMQEGMQEAERLKLDIFLLATSAVSLAMYKKLGFEYLDGSEQSLKPWGYDEMFHAHYLIKRNQ